MRLFFGTYPHEIPELAPEGIWSASFDCESAEVTELTQIAELAAPSFIAMIPGDKRILAVTEQHDGALTQLAFIEGELTAQVTTSTQGSDPCHIIVAGNQAIATNYSSGSVFSTTYPLSSEEGHEGVLFQEVGSGPVLDRQEGPHAHFAGQIPSTQYIWVSDLGADRIFSYQLTQNEKGDAQLHALGEGVAFAPGTGPRHIAFHGKQFAYVVGELDGKIHSVQIDPANGTGIVVSSVQILEQPREGDLASHIELSGDSSILFVTVRGSNRIVAFSVGENGELSPLTSASVQGDWPRHFRVVSGSGELTGQDLVIIANQYSHTIDVLGFSRKTKEFHVFNTYSVPSPACVVAVE